MKIKFPGKTLKIIDHIFLFYNPGFWPFIGLCNLFVDIVTLLIDIKIYRRIFEDRYLRKPEPVNFHDLFVI
jgi:hypothetical protein